MTSKLGEWIEARLAECSPGGSRGRAGVGDLLAAADFFRGNRSQIFGMNSEATKIPEADALRAACIGMLQRWFVELAGEPSAQVGLYEAAARMKLDIGLPEPAIVTQKRELVAERDRALDALGRPSETLQSWPKVQQELSDLRTAAASIAPKRIQKYLRLPRGLSVASFEWLEDSWRGIADADVEPELLPIAGADGDYLGVYVSMELLREDGNAPVLYFSHEEDPPYSFVFEGCGVGARVLRAAATNAAKKDVAPGRPTSAVAAWLSARAATPLIEATADAHAFERSGDGFAATHVRARQMWQDFDRRLRRLGA